MHKKHTVKIISALLSGVAMLSSFGCRSASDIPDYAKQDFVTFGFWSPYELTQESFTLYKQSGLNTLFFTNHSVTQWTSDNLHYLGSNATQKSLELCRKTGLNAILNYGDWYRTRAEGEPFSGTPFSDYNLYGDYKDIIVGMHIADEPNLEKIDEYGLDTLTADFQSVYDVPYMVNLFPDYASMEQIGTQGYRHYVQTYADKVVSDFEENRLLSVDFYPFQRTIFHPSWLFCYNEIAKIAKATGSKRNYYIQTSVGSEFQYTLSAEEIAIQLNVAMAFGADWFGFFCYETPRTYQADGAYEPKYQYCMLNPDGTPSPLYYAVQGELARVGAFSDVYLAYDWVKTVPVLKTGGFTNQAFRMLGKTDFTGTALNQVTSTGDTVVGCFDSAEYGEAFMLVNYGKPSEQTVSTVEMEFSKGKYVAVYGIEDEPQIMKLKQGKLSVELSAGAGCFVTVL